MRKRLKGLRTYAPRIWNSLFFNIKDFNILFKKLIEKQDEIQIQIKDIKDVNKRYRNIHA